MERICCEIKDAELRKELLFKLESQVHFNALKHAIYRYTLRITGIVTDKKSTLQIAIDWLEHKRYPLWDKWGIPWNFLNLGTFMMDNWDRRLLNMEVQAYIEI